MDDEIKAREPKRVFSIADEDGNQLDFWTIQDDSCERVHIGLHCSQPLDQDSVLDALQFFIDEVREKSVNFLDFTKLVKH